MTLLLHARRIASPVGNLALAVDGEGRLVRLAFQDHEGPGAIERTAARAGESVAWEREDAGEGGPCSEAASQLAAYVRSERVTFDLPLAPRGTPFQRLVWDELGRIPLGATVTYRELAARIGRPAAIRAAGRANATNPIGIIIPCHRVIGSDGSLTGYGGGMDAKRWLLDFEAATATVPR